MHVLVKNLFTKFNDFRAVGSYKRSRLIFHLLLRHDITPGSVATHLRCGGIFSDGIITNVLIRQ